jgi:hypothetical protein
MITQQTIGLGVHHWKSMQGQALTFFALLDDVRRQVGDEALGPWCEDHLGINLKQIKRRAGLLKQDDENRVLRDLKPAIQADKDRRRNSCQVTVRRYRLKEKPEMSWADTRERLIKQDTEDWEAIGNSLAKAIKHCRSVERVTPSYNLPMKRPRMAADIRKELESILERWGTLRQSV